LKIVNPRVKGHVVVALRQDNGVFVTITSCRISFGLESFEPVITGMFNDEASSQFVSRFLSNLVTELLDFFEEDVTNFISTTVRVVGNRILADLDLGSLLPISSVAP
ncbi:jg17222, partial [Pararge aegeria aegeria]